MSDFNFATAATAVTSHERKGARLESTYDSLVSFLGLDGATVSTEITAAARSIVITGANNDGTATGAAITEDDLTGRDPGADVKSRDYWKAARTVRIGLVNAIKRAAGDDEDEDEVTVPVMRITLKGAGSAVVPETFSGTYADLVALMSSEA